MKQRIIDALKTELKELGLGDKTFGRLADYIVSKGTVTTEDEISAAVKGEDVKLIAKSIQGEIDGIKKAKDAAEAALADYKAKHPEGKGEKDDEKKEDDTDDWKTALADAVKDAIAPLSAEIAALKSSSSAKEALTSAREKFFGGDYAKKYKDQAEDAWDRAVELNEATGSKMTSDAIVEKASGYFNKSVSRLGVDTTKPFVADPPKNDEDGTLDWSSEKKRLQDAGRLPKEQ